MSHKALNRAELLHVRRKGGRSAAPSQSPRRGTIVFMVVLHTSAMVALLPRFWSWQAVLTLGILYWATACLGVTIGYPDCSPIVHFEFPSGWSAFLPPAVP